MKAGGHPGEASASTSLASSPNDGTDRWNVLLSTNLRDMISQNWREESASDMRLSRVETERERDVR